MVKAIEVENVSKSFGKRLALDNVSFWVDQGDTFGYLGPNGSGKTTTIRILLDLLKPKSGKVSVLGHDIFKDVVSAKLRIGFVLEADGLYQNMTAMENLAYYSRIYGIPDYRTRSKELLSLMGLDDRADEKVSSYSKGMRQRLALARAMVHDPDILILDEPTSGVDPTGQMEVRSLVIDLAHKFGKTIFFSSHNLDEVQRICKRVALIHQGQIRLCGDLNELRTEGGLSKVMIQTADEEAPLDKVAKELGGVPWIQSCVREGKNLIVQLSKGSPVHELVGLLCSKGVRVDGVNRIQASLEDIYASMVRDSGGRK